MDDFFYVVILLLLKHVHLGPFTSVKIVNNTVLHLKCLFQARGFFHAHKSPTNRPEKTSPEHSTLTLTQQFILRIENHGITCRRNKRQRTPGFRVVPPRACYGTCDSLQVRDLPGRHLVDLPTRKEYCCASKCFF